MCSAAVIKDTLFFNGSQQLRHTTKRSPNGTLPFCTIYGAVTRRQKIVLIQPVGFDVTTWCFKFDRPRHTVVRRLPCKGCVLVVIAVFIVDAVFTDIEVISWWGCDFAHVYCKLFTPTTHTFGSSCHVNTSFHILIYYIYIIYNTMFI